MTVRDKPIRVNVTKALKTRLQNHAKKNETSVASIIRKAVEEYLIREEDNAD